MKGLFQLVLLWAYHMLTNGTPYETQLLEDIKLSTLADHNLYPSHITQDINSDLKENCNQTICIENVRARFSEKINFRDGIFDFHCSENLSRYQRSAPTKPENETILEYFKGIAIEPQYYEFYKWYYKNIQKTPPEKLLQQIAKDQTFEPAEPTNTPFPVPQQHRYLYSWLLLQKDVVLPNATDATSTTSTTIDPSQEIKSNSTTEDLITIDGKLKSTLEVHFTETIESRYESFYKWLYHALDNGTENLYYKNREWINDFHFSPADFLTSTPFPIPSRHQALYEWISFQRANVTTTTPGKRVKRVKRDSQTTMDGLFKSTLEQFFTETIEPQYELFYQWLYRALKNGSESVPAKNKEWINDDNFTPCSEDFLTSTPFPIRLRHQALYEWILYKEANSSSTTVEAEGSKRVKRDLATTPMPDEDNQVQNYFTDKTIQPEHRNFYKWFYDVIKKENKSPQELLKQLPQDSTHSTPSQSQSTPFPIPPDYIKLYQWLSSQKDTESANQEILKQNLENHFTETIEPKYLTFYNWLYKKLDNGKISVYQKIGEYIDDYFFTMVPEITDTPFPIPYKYWALFDWIRHPRLNMTRKTKIYSTPPVTPDLATAGEANLTPDVPDLDTYKPTVAEDRLNSESKKLLEEHFTETIEPRFERFYKWLYEELDQGKISIYKKIGEWIDDPDFDPSEQVTNKPFPVPYRHQALYEWILYQKGNPTRGPPPTIPTVDYDGIFDLRRRKREINFSPDGVEAHPQYEENLLQLVI